MTQLARSFRFILLFLVVLIAADQLTGFVLESMYLRLTYGSNISGKVNGLLHETGKRDLLLVGSSRIQHHVDPDSLSDLTTYNLGVGGSGIVYSDCVISIVANAGKLPPIVLLHLDEKNFLVKPDDSLQYSALPSLYYYYGKNSTTTKYISESVSYVPLRFCFRSYPFNGRVPDLIKNFYLSVRTGVDPNDGYLPIKPTPRDSFNTEYSANLSRDTTGVKITSTQAMQALDNIVATCTRNGSRLVCFSAPVYRGAINVYYKGNHDQVRHEISTYLSDKQIPYFDYAASEKELGIDGPEFYKDATHLNERGARLLSGRLYRDLSASGVLPSSGSE